jgi:uncharacterized protein
MLTLEIRKPREIQWRTITNFSHNLLIPAHTHWYKDGQKSYEIYYVNGKYHRDSTVGPAYTSWYSDGQKEREYYHVNDECHRDPNLGPTCTHWYNDGQKEYEAYYVNGVKVSKPC